MYGVFILRDNKWHLHCTYNDKTSATHEVDYLVKMLGLNAKLFVKTH
jgi:hypothetical protein